MRWEGPDLSVVEARAKAFEYKTKIARAKTRSVSAKQSERRCAQKRVSHSWSTNT
jgi:hypothetical protein